MSSPNPTPTPSPDLMPGPIPSVVVTRRAPSPPGVHARLVLVQAMTPFAQALVRALRTYLQAWVGLLLIELAGKPVLANVGVIVPATDFLVLAGTAASLAIAPTVISFVQNVVEILARFDDTHPQLRA